MQKKIKELVEKRNVQWKKHAIKRILERGITRVDIFEALSDCIIIETHKIKRPLPSHLVLGYYRDKPLHIMVATDGNENLLWIITVYQPTLDEWESDFRTRRIR